MIAIMMVIFSTGMITAQNEVVFKFSKNTEGGEEKSHSISHETENNQVKIDGTGLSVLEYYQIAYDKPESRFIFPEELNFISQERYNLEFSGTREQLIDLLNANLNIATKTEREIFSVLVLKEIRIENNIKQASSESLRMRTTGTSETFGFQGLVKTSGIVELIAPQFKCMVIPDESIEERLYEVDCSVKIDVSEKELINNFKEEGIILVRDNKEVDVVKMSSSRMTIY